MSGGDLYAAASLIGGYCVAGPGCGYVQNASFDFGVYFAANSGPVYASATIVADGHGVNTSGDGNASGYAQVGLNGDGGSGFCRFSLNGGDQSCSTGIVYLGDIEGIGFAAAVSATLPTTNDSAAINYWGTFTLEDIQLYNSNGQQIGTYSLAPPVPEPSSLALFGLGMLGLLGMLALRGRGKVVGLD
jgi:hypothetical protein